MEQVISEQESEHKDASGRKGKTKGQTISYRPKFSEVVEYEERYTTLSDQVMLIKKRLMILEPGWRFVRGGTATEPEYVPMEVTPWDSFRGLADVKFEKALAEVKRGSAYREPMVLLPPSNEPDPPPPTNKGGGGMK